jgi:hypothetical protein
MRVDALSSKNGFGTYEIIALSGAGGRGESMRPGFTKSADLEYAPAASAEP